MHPVAARGADTTGVAQANIRVNLSHDWLAPGLGNRSERVKVTVIVVRQRPLAAAERGGSDQVKAG